MLRASPLLQILPLALSQFNLFFIWMILLSIGCIFTFLFYFLGALNRRIGLLWLRNTDEIIEIYVKVLSNLVLFLKTGLLVIRELLVLIPLLLKLIYCSL